MSQRRAPFRSTPMPGASTAASRTNVATRRLCLFQGVRVFWMRAPSVDDSHLIGINPLPFRQSIEQSYRLSRPKQQRCIDLIFIEQSDKSARRRRYRIQTGLVKVVVTSQQGEERIGARRYRRRTACLARGGGSGSREPRRVHRRPNDRSRRTAQFPTLVPAAVGLAYAFS